MSRRPGFVLEVDKSTPPTLFWNGEGFTLETLPEGSRVIYAPEPMKALDDPYGAIRHALLHPMGDRDPLPELLYAGMKLTICFDDISLPSLQWRRRTSAKWSSRPCSTWPLKRAWMTSCW